MPLQSTHRVSLPLGALQESTCIFSTIMLGFNKKAAVNLVATICTIAGPCAGLHKAPGAVPPDMCLEVVTKMPSRYKLLSRKIRLH
jgi:hypothetical protein